MRISTETNNWTRPVVHYLPHNERRKPLQRIFALLVSLTCGCLAGSDWLAHACIHLVDLLVLTSHSRSTRIRSSNTTFSFIRCPLFHRGVMNDISEDIYLPPGHSAVLATAVTTGQSIHHFRYDLRAMMPLTPVTTDHQVNQGSSPSIVIFATMTKGINAHRWSNSFFFFIVAVGAMALSHKGSLK